MSDLVKRLRAVSLDFGVPSTTTIDSAAIRKAADRIEALEAEVLEQARLLGKSGEQELALRTENASLKIGLDTTSANLIAAQEEVTRLRSALSDIQAVIEETASWEWEERVQKVGDIARAALAPPQE